MQSRMASTVSSVIDVRPDLTKYPPMLLSGYSFNPELFLSFGGRKVLILVEIAQSPRQYCVSGVRTRISH